MNPLHEFFLETKEFIPLSIQNELKHNDVECPNVEYNMVHAFFNSEGDIVYSPMATFENEKKNE